MSTTADKISPVTTLAHWLGALTGMLTADINAIPEDKWTATFGGCTRPCSAMIADTSGLLIWMTAVLKNETPPADYMGIISGNETACSTKAGAISTYTTAATAFTEALTSASEETLGKTIMAPWQMETPVFMLANIAVSHVWYHDGQINYVQCLLGDEKVHWMGD